MEILRGSMVGDATGKITSTRQVDAAVTRKAIQDAMRLGNLDAASNKFLTFPGILPVNWPEGTKFAVIPDVHVPAHNKRIIWAALEFLRDFQPHILIFIGDVADIFALSRWPAPPRVVKNLQHELDETRRLIDQFIEYSGCWRAYLIMGNHEDRIRRYLMDLGAAIAGVLDFNTREPVLTFHGLLGFKPGDPVTFIYDSHERAGLGGGLLVNCHLYFPHGYVVRPFPGASPRAVADRIGRSTGHGHTHRAGNSARLTTNGVIQAYEFGHLVDVEHPYMGYADLLNNWQPAIGAGIIAGGKVHLKTLPIKQTTRDGKTRFKLVFGNRAYTQSDR